MILKINYASFSNRMYSWFMSVLGKICVLEMYGVRLFFFNLKINYY